MRDFILAFLGLTALTTFSAHALEGPSYDDTVSFLASKLNVSNNKYTQEISYPERCVMKVDYYARRFRKEDFLKFRSIYLIPLEKMDPSNTPTIHARENKEVIELTGIVTSTKRNSIEKYYRDYGSDPDLSCDPKQLKCVWATDYDDYFWFSLVLSPEEDNNPRVLKAMSHLIRLCGGKEELF